MQDRILYPTGGGGAWLQSVMYGLITHNYTAIDPTCNHNFHTRSRNEINLELRDKYKFRICHGFDRFLKFESFASPLTRYNVYVNAIEKYYKENNEIPADFNERLNFLTNIASYTFSTEYQKYYLDNIVIDHSMLFLDPEKVINQINNWLVDHGIQFDKNSDFVYNMINNYKDTVKIDNYYNNDSDHWLAWTHALMNYNNIIVPFDTLHCTKTEFINFSKTHSSYILEQTKGTVLFE